MTTRNNYIFHGKARHMIRNLILAGCWMGLVFAGTVQAQNNRNLPREHVIDVPAIGDGLCVHNAFQSNMVLQREKPVRIFEIGSCFRKESQGAQHANEFTMLNLVEMGLETDARQERLEEFIALVTEAAGVKDFVLETVHSTVYGETIDILAGLTQPALVQRDGRGGLGLLPAIRDLIYHDRQQFPVDIVEQCHLLAAEARAMRGE